MRRLLALAAVVALFAACSNGGDDETAAPTTATTTTGATTTSAPAGTTGTTAQPAIPRLRLEQVAELDEPLAMATLGRDVYVAEKGGRVKRLQGSTARTVLDISGQVSTGSEQGLLGIAFSADGSKAYVHFTNRDGDTRLVEYDSSFSQDSARELLAVDQPFANHNGGQLAVGRDGMLYMALGDGGSGGDPEGNAQNLGTLLGKILRIDPRPADGRPYGIPRDNPFVGRDGARGEIWAYGLRNPWRFSFDRETGDLWIGDVGQNSREEVDRVSAGEAAGANFGWDRVEGNRRFEGDPPADYVPPVHDYATADGACAVTGGYVYRGEALPGLRGVYVFGDYCRGDLWGLVHAGDGYQRVDLGARVEVLSSFGEDADGELYALSLRGAVYRLTAA